MPQIIEVDGLPVEVDGDFDIEEIRAARAALRLDPLPEGDEEPDYKTLYGEDA